MRRHRYLSASSTLLPSLPAMQDMKVPKLQPTNGFVARCNDISVPSDSSFSEMMKHRSGAPSFFSNSESRSSNYWIGGMRVAQSGSSRMSLATSARNFLRLHQRG